MHKESTTVLMRSSSVYNTKCTALQLYVQDASVHSTILGWNVQQTLDESNTMKRATNRNINVSSVITFPNIILNMGIVVMLILC